MYTVQLRTTLGNRWGVSDLYEETVSADGDELPLRMELVEIASSDLERLAMEGEWTIFHDEGCSKCAMREVLYDILVVLDYAPKITTEENDQVAAICKRVQDTLSFFSCAHQETNEVIDYTNNLSL